MYWYSDFRQLLFIGTSVLIGITLSYDYVTTEGLADVFLGIIGTGLLLALMLIVPILLFDRSLDSD